MVIAILLESESTQPYSIGSNNRFDKEILFQFRRYDNGHDLEDLEGHSGHPFSQDIDPNQIFQAFFGGGAGGMGGAGGGQHQHFSFGGAPGGAGGGSGFSFQFG